MGENSIIQAILFALLAAVGNALFAYGQKKAIILENAFIFLFFSLIVCIVCIFIAMSLSQKVSVLGFVENNYPWFLISGVGFFLTFYGFNLLYSHYGASYYSLYAVLSILTTSIVVGVIIFRESFNSYHLLASLTAILTVVLFSLGQWKSSGQ